MLDGHGSADVGAVINVADTYLSDQACLTGVAPLIDSSDVVGVAGAQATISVDPDGHAGASEKNATSCHMVTLTASQLIDGHIETMPETWCCCFPPKQLFPGRPLSTLMSPKGDVR